MQGIISQRYVSKLLIHLSKRRYQLPHLPPFTVTVTAKNVNKQRFSLMGSNWGHLMLVHEMNIVIFMQYDSNYVIICGQRELVFSATDRI